MVVGTPIGNLDDLTPRAAAVLAAADVVCCEDTRHTGMLLKARSIAVRRLVAVHEHNEAQMAERVEGWLEAGQTVALVSDAGMPGVSDPGERVVAAAAAAGHRVEVIPGPSAVMCALVASGLPTDRFCFDGFLPRKGSARAARLKELAVEQRTVALYEAANRVAATLEDLVNSCGVDRPVALCRELTKKFEEVWRGTLLEAMARVAKVAPRGEYVIVLGGAPAPAELDDATVAAAVAQARADGLSARDAAARVVAELGVSKRRAYDAAVGQSR